MWRVRKMKCRHCRELAFEYTDGTLGAAQADELKRHVATCSECRVYVAEWERVRQGFAYVPRPAMPRSVVPDVLREVRHAEAPSIWQRIGLGTAYRMVAVGAGLSIILALVFMFGTNWMGDHRGEGDVPHGTIVVHVQPTFADVLPDLSVFRREHALFARGGTSLDRNIWMAAVNVENLSLLDE
jgi:predicted anti-sigma-YlaC factor YlaD